MEWGCCCFEENRIQLALIGEEYANAWTYLHKKKEDYEGANQRLLREKKSNKTLESEIMTEERNIAKIREDIADKDGKRHNLEGEVSILKNQLISFATELTNKRTMISSINTELQNKMERLDAAEKKYNATKDKLEKEKGSKDNLEAANTNAEDGYKEARSMMDAVEKDVRLKNDELFKESQQLFEFR